MRDLFYFVLAMFVIGISGVEVEETENTTRYILLFWENIF